VYLVAFDFYCPSKCGSYFCRILYMHKQVRTSGESLTKYVDHLWVKVGQPCTTASYSHFFKYLTRAGVHTGFCREDTMEGDHWQDLTVDGKITLQWIFKKCDGEALTGLLWLRTGTGGGRL
jgi:hypothetical protein